MLLGVLGPVVLHGADGCPVRLGSARQRRLLAALPEHDTNTAALTGRDGTVVEAIGAGGGLVEIAGDPEHENGFEADAS